MSRLDHVAAPGSPGEGNEGVAAGMLPKCGGDKARCVCVCEGGKGGGE